MMNEVEKSSLNLSKDAKNENNRAEVENSQTESQNKLKRLERRNFYHDLLLLELDLERHNKRYKPSKKKLIILIFTLILLSGCIVAISLLQNNTIDLYLDEDTEKIESNSALCRLVDFSNFNIISHPFAGFLILIYLFLFWRRSCCLKCFIRRPGPPMIIHPFKKSERFMSACVYGIIAFEVMQIVNSAISKTSAADQYARLVQDPSGLFKLLMRIVEVFVAALRYYPVLVAFNAHSIFIYFTSAVFMLADVGINIYVEGKCEGFDDFLEDKEEIRVYGTSRIGKTIVKDAPHFFLLSLVTITLWYKAFESIFLLGKNINPKDKLLINEDIQFFSKYDIKYSFNLLNRKNSNEEENENSEKETKSKGGAKKKLKRLFQRFIYKWHNHFKFSSRVLSAHLVAFLALYYFFIEWMFEGIFLIRKLIGTSANLLDLMFGSIFGMFVDENFSLDFGKIVVNNDHIIGFSLSASFAYLICNIQCLLGLRSIKYDLIKAYKGKHQSMGKLASNVSICNGNSHFTGFLVGFLINGFVFIFGFFFLICFIVYYLVQFVSWSQVRDFILRLVPIITVIIVKFVFNFICSKFFFLQQRGNVLALDNFRAYSIFVYVTFFFDCFVGTVKAFIRLLLGLLGSLFFMPRIGYSFLGRFNFKLHLENMFN
jgi:hypothetical protein